MKTEQDTSYNGYMNWDTWNAALWLCNDEWAYREARRATTYKRYEEILEMLGNPDGIDYKNVSWIEVDEAINPPEDEEEECEVDIYEFFESKN